MTQIDAINTIISAIGESPVNTLENVTNVDVINALRMLDGQNRQFQSKGWSFNVVDSFTLNPDVFTNMIPWNDAWLYVNGTDGTKYVRRDGYLYDFTNQTATYTLPVTVELIVYTAFDDMPEAAQTYITARTAKMFQVRYLGDPALAEELARDEQIAWADLQEYELERNDYNALQFQGIQTLLQR